ncbi:MAG: alpha/beta fold hydrolase [Candidatus Rokubacteria bacterium]|nr:alpha/beta fold hydrolase [Candidatus Rokubacteria bacterium]
MSASVPPFTIKVGDDALADLRDRLTRVRWPDEIPGSDWKYGTDLAFMRGLVEHWRTRYDWRAAEAILNAFPQFTAPVAGIDVHFIHAPGVGPKPMPLLLSHGWPGSVWEFHKIIPMLTDPARFGGSPADAFTVVAPSLPGYGFSFRPNQPRFGTVEIADIFATLMTEVLGYERYGAQGGDWGSVITARLGFRQPARVAGIHLNMTFVRPDRAQKEWSDAERAYLADAKRFTSEETGYQRIQGTKPQTLAYALTDSPVGLAAWIVEKFRTWSDCGGDVERRFTKDELLTNVMIYWITGAIGSSFWPYYAFHHAAWVPSAAERVETPTAIAEFPCEILRPPRPWAERAYNLQRWTTMPAGGHFAAMEEPAALAADIRAFFRALR